VCAIPCLGPAWRRSRRRRWRLPRWWRRWRVSWRRWRFRRRPCRRWLQRPHERRLSWRTFDVCPALVRWRRTLLRRILSRRRSAAEQSRRVRILRARRLRLLWSRRIWRRTLWFERLCRPFWRRLALECAFRLARGRRRPLAQLRQFSSRNQRLGNSRICGFTGHARRRDRIAHNVDRLAFVWRWSGCTRLRRRQRHNLQRFLRGNSLVSLRLVPRDEFCDFLVPGGFEFRGARLGLS